jgi:DNA-binding CsgD family transcriptional regulator
VFGRAAATYRDDMDDAARRRHVDALIDRCYAGLDADELRIEILRRLRGVVSVDAAFFATLDPVTLLPTSAASEEPLVEAAGRFLDNEFGDPDVNRFVDLARRPDPVRSLDAATAGDRQVSRRYTSIMAPLALGDELRVVFRSGGRSWGVMCLHREDALAGFSAAETAVVRRIGPHVAEGLRRAQVLHGGDPPAESPGSGIVVLGPELDVRAMTAAAEVWLGRIADPEWPRSSALPVAVLAVAARLVGGEGTDDRPPEVRLRTATGQWLSVRASWLHGGDGRQVAVVLEPATPTQLSSVFFAVRGLTPAQERVAALVVRGRDTQQVGAALHISAHTVQEHLKAVFDKFGVRSRRELVAALLGGP